MRLALTCSAPIRKKYTFKLGFATVVDNITIQLYSVIAKNSNKRLKRSVAQCLRSYSEGESYRAWYRKERSKKLNRDYSFKIIFEGQFLAYYYT